MRWGSHEIRSLTSPQSGRSDPHGKMRLGARRRYLPLDSGAPEANRRTNPDGSVRENDGGRHPDPRRG